MNITIRITNNYGKAAIYPVCEKAHKLADLIGKKTFTDAAISKLINLGYTLTIQRQSLS
jgi:hypothetical protein